MEDENPFPEIVEIEVTDVLDLHSFAPRDVKRIVQEYLMLAREKGFKVVRIIHGKGIVIPRKTSNEIKRFDATDCSSAIKLTFADGLKEKVQLYLCRYLVAVK